MRHGLEELLINYRSNAEKYIKQLTGGRRKTQLFFLSLLSFKNAYFIFCFKDLDLLENLLPFHVTRINRLETDRQFTGNFNNNNNGGRHWSNWSNPRRNNNRSGLYSPPGQSSSSSANRARSTLSTSMDNNYATDNHYGTTSSAYPSNRNNQNQNSTRQQYDAKPSTSGISKTTNSNQNVC